MHSDETLAWLTLSRAPGLRAEALGAAVSLAGGAAALVRGGERWRDRLGVSREVSDALRRAPRAARAEGEWLRAPEHHLIPFTHPRYPTLLRPFADRPIALYATGNVDALGEPPLAVVGSRNPTPQGAETAFDLAAAVAHRGVAVVSGLALGIDTAAHRGSLAAQGVTLAVLGSGADIVYPASNRGLAALIEHEGLLLSALPLGAPPRRLNFPSRNRLMAALCRGVVVVEAALGSGSLITARAARERERTVFAVPGSIRNPLTRGCHRLIRDGARLVETADDIFRELNFFGGPAAFAPAPHGTAAPAQCAPGMDKDRKILLDALGFDPADLDMLIVRTGFKPEAVSSMMLILELEGHVQTGPGGRYSRVAYRRAGGER